MFFVGSSVEFKGKKNIKKNSVWKQVQNDNVREKVFPKTKINHYSWHFFHISGEFKALVNKKEKSINFPWSIVFPARGKIVHRNKLNYSRGFFSSGIFFVEWFLFIVCNLENMDYFYLAVTSYAAGVFDVIFSRKRIPVLSTTATLKFARLMMSRFWISATHFFKIS